MHLGPIFIDFFGTNLSFSTAYHPQTDGLAKRMIQALEDMIKRFCTYGFTNYWLTLIPELRLEYRKSVHSSTGQTPDMLEEGWNSRLPADILRKDLIEIYPEDSSFKLFLDEVKNNAKKRMNDAF
ncbi:hypothetical protein O181_016444 [Austropuccinia psidii MF-1]|uniref:Integrase catalytic domain-containing protein n=1 Tax=Austropuccinia psidii MF-1 TaxID=1389203 RepID=A0A9Q3C1Q5_9BASI|nr:hypothetical protein [Austropuccinia psidii MF-1]